MFIRALKDVQGTERYKVLINGTTRIGAQVGGDVQPGGSSARYLAASSSVYRAGMALHTKAILV